MHMEKILLKKTLSIFLPYKGKPEPPWSTDRGWIKQVWYVHALEVHVTNKNDGKNFTEDWKIVSWDSMSNIFYCLKENSFKLIHMQINVSGIIYWVGQKVCLGFSIRFCGSEHFGQPNISIHFSIYLFLDSKIRGDFHIVLCVSLCSLKLLE